MKSFNLYSIPYGWFIFLGIFIFISLSFAFIAFLWKVLLFLFSGLYLVYQARKERCNFFKRCYHLTFLPDHWLIEDDQKQHLAKLKKIVYQSKYFLFINWQFSFSGQPLTKIFCFWHYSAEQWRCLQVLFRIYPPAFSSYEK